MAAFLARGALNVVSLISIQQRGEAEAELNVVNKLYGVADLHPLLIQRAPHAVQLGNVCLCQAAPVLAQVVHIQIPDVLFVGPQLLQICEAQVAFISSNSNLPGITRCRLPLWHWPAEILCMSTPLASLCSQDGPA